MYRSQNNGVTVGARSIVKAGTPINIDLTNLLTPAKKPAAAAEGSSAVPMNAVLLHDVDVTNVKEGGNANGTALVFGFVNLNRVEASVATAITTAQAITGSSPLLVFSKQ